MSYDYLKGRKCMVWTFMGNSRMYQALAAYGDRLSQVGLFSFKVSRTGVITESGVAISNMLTYINRWPHIKWLLTISNDGTNSIFAALRDNTDGAQDTFLSEIVRIMEKYPWCDGIDIDLEKGDGYSTHAASTAMFRNIYNTVKGYDNSKLINICLPGMNSINGSVGGENWCVYGDLNAYCDTAAIMSYGMAWAGSAPGAVSPRDWLEGIYDYAVTVMNPEKIFFGLPAYGWNWQIYDLPANLGKTYRGTSNTYYAAKNWMTGQYNFTDDAPPQPFIPLLAYWDDYDMVPWALPQVYDFMEGRDATSYEYLLMNGTYNRRHYLTAYSKEQHTEFGTIYVDADGRQAPTPALYPLKMVWPLSVTLALPHIPFPYQAPEPTTSPSASAIPSGIKTASMFRLTATRRILRKAGSGGHIGEAPSGRRSPATFHYLPGRTPS